MYANLFMIWEEFEQMADHSLYCWVGQKYDAERSFPQICNKVNPEKWLFDIDKVVRETKIENEAAVVL